VRRARGQRGVQRDRLDQAAVQEPAAVGGADRLAADPGQARGGQQRLAQRGPVAHVGEVDRAGGGDVAGHAVQLDRRVARALVALGVQRVGVVVIQDEADVDDRAAEQHPRRVDEAAAGEGAEDTTPRIPPPSAASATRWPSSREPRARRSSRTSRTEFTPAA
jgi:hypothetical protein